MAIASAACSVGLIVLWADSYFHERHACQVETTVNVNNPPTVVWRERTVGVTSFSGQLLFGTLFTRRGVLPPPPEYVLARSTHWSIGSGGGSAWAEPFNNRPTGTSVNWWGFGFVDTIDYPRGELTVLGPQTRRAVAVPHWFAVLATSLLPARSLIAWRQRRQHRRGFDVSVM